MIFHVEMQTEEENQEIRRMNTIRYDVKQEVEEYAGKHRCELISFRKLISCTQSQEPRTIEKERNRIKTK